MIDQDRILQIYTDGSADHRKNGGWSMFCQDFDQVRVGFLTRTTNNRMELFAISTALDYMIEGVYRFAIIRSDSQYAVKGINDWSTKWKDKDYEDVANADLFMMINFKIEKLRRMNRNVELVWVKGHDKTHGNIVADKAAQNARKKLINTIYENTHNIKNHK